MRACRDSRSAMRTIYFVSMFMLGASTGCAIPPSYVRTPAESRAYVLEYCRVQCEANASKPRKPYRATFERALNGEFRALHTVFTDESYHTNDMEWDLVPWHILQVIGDSRYADFVVSRPAGERSTLLALQWPHVSSEKQASFEAFFRKRFPRTFRLWASDGTTHRRR